MRCTYWRECSEGSDRRDLEHLPCERNMRELEHTLYEEMLRELRLYWRERGSGDFLSVCTST